MTRPRAVIADDELLLRQGLERLLTDGGVDVVASAGDATDLIRKTQAHRPDIVITDVRMPPELTDDGLRAAIAIRRALPGTGVLVVSQHLAERYALQLLGNDAQGVGYLLKDRIADLDDFLDAVRTVASGGTALDAEVVARMMGRRRRENPLEHLTPRERDVLALIVEGLSNHGIAERLHVGPHAVEKHVTSIFEKLELGHDRADHRRVLAVLKVLRAS
ncbi:response regulator transcription factor [Solirubrobacter soli]|uniref:response regulator transcription factor n=1 Tax=Solirubrobacter soli TaxID=363832 RepID=UPI0003FDA06B|nr:response regulator transcription factor [Solirubrobacter soli]